MPVMTASVFVAIVTMATAVQVSSLAVRAEDPGAPNAPVQVSDFAKARQMAAQACVDDPDLHGVWIDLVPDTEAQAEQMQFKARVLVDSVHGDKQLQNVRALLDRLPLDPKPSIASPVYRAPFSTLVASVQAAVEEKLDSRGCFIQGAYYEEPAEPPVVPTNTQPGEVESSTPTSRVQLNIVFYGRLPGGRLLPRLFPGGLNAKGERADNGDYHTFIINRCVEIMSSSDWENLRTAGWALQPLHDRLVPRGLSEQALVDVRWFNQAVYSDQQLHGVRVDLEECVDHQGKFSHYDVYLYVDAGQAAEQRSRMYELLETQLGDRYELCGDVALPLSRLLTRLDLLIESRPGLDGCFVEGAYFSSDVVGGQPQPKLVLYGRVAKGGESVRRDSDAIVSLCSALVQLDPAWRGYEKDFATVSEGLAVVPPSLARGERLFGTGITAFWAGRYDAAHAAFEHAILEVPGALSFRYWRILTEMRLGKRDDALDHMIAIQRRNPTPTAYRQVLGSLARVQGPLRADLLALEHRARMEFHLHQNRLLPGEVLSPAAAPQTEQPGPQTPAPSANESTPEHQADRRPHRVNYPPVRPAGLRHTAGSASRSTGRSTSQLAER